MPLAALRIGSGLARLGLSTLLAFAVLAAGHAASAQAQTVPDPDYWKQTAERQNTVNRFVYGQSPQPIPSVYDPVAEAEQLLRQRQATLAPSNPQAPSLWQQVRGITVKSALSTPPRALGTITLGLTVLTGGWKIGSGINAKLLKFGVPDTSNAGPADYRWDKIVWTPALTRTWAGASWPAQDGWVLWARQTCCNYTPRDWWYNPECVASPYGFQPPEPFAIGGPVWSGSFCYNPAPPGYTDALVYYASAPENALGAPGPIEPYTNQPYTYSSPAPTAPPQTTVEQSIENELAKPENSLLRQWLNYELGSPGEQDPVGDGVNVPQPAIAPGDGADVFVQQLEELDLTNVKFKVLSNPDFEPAFDEGAVVRVSPPPGTHVQPGEEIEVTANRTAQQQNNGECDRGPHQDPGSPPSGDEFSLKDTFSGSDPDQGMAPTDVPFRWGTTDWGYRHVELGHGWDNDRDRADTQAALYDPVPEPDQPGSHRFYFFYLGPNRVPCTRRVVARFDVNEGESAKRGIITSFAHPGWWRRSDFD